MRAGILVAMAAAMLGCGRSNGVRNQTGAAGNAVGGAGGGVAGAGGGADAGGGSAGGGAGALGIAGAGGAAGSAGTGGSAGAAGSSDSAGAGGSAGGAAGSAGGGAGAGGGGGAPSQPLDMNDVTILVPLPKSTAAPVLLNGGTLADDGTAMVPRTLVDRLAKTDLGLPSDLYNRLQLVAVRFDLCDRHLPGACPEDEDARMRLVFQPIVDPPAALDVGFHAFYAIRNDEIAGAVAALRELAGIAPPQAGALRVSPALSAADPEPYAGKLRAFVKRYGGDARIVRLTMNAQSFVSNALRWVLRGAEKQGDAFVDIPIVGTSDTSQSIVLAGNPSYSVTPMTDTPPGLLGAITMTTFVNADEAKQRDYLAALAAADNPMSHTAETVACVACHVSTVIMSARTGASIDPLTLPGRYTSKFDLSIANGNSAQTTTTLRAFGYLRTQPMISQRVVNDTAQTLTEIEARYP
ncbi:MAG TPA: hypothetical protein VIF57_25215 [Polyangia bacterium]|jgi:hypothetical protein